ncbi:flavodoxin [Ensifer sp. 2YAB10]|uniref:flavodoxin n=1 Tax=unclassified Ensifer TaxID=2633371 RepID=UPI003F91C423
MPNEIARRYLLKSLPLTAASLALTTGRSSAQQEPAGPNKTLVAYFSRTGNTALIARQIRRARSAALIEITAAVPYPEDYEETVAQASQETKSGYLPPLAKSAANIAQHETVYLGFPIWSMTAPPAVRSFLSAHDLSGKVLVPFITHGGYGLGNSIEILHSLAPGSDLKAPFSMEADQERRTLEQVSGWLVNH